MIKKGKCKAYAKNGLPEENNRQNNNGQKIIKNKRKTLANACSWELGKNPTKMVDILQDC